MGGKSSGMKDCDLVSEMMHYIESVSPSAGYTSSLLRSEWYWLRLNMSEMLHHILAGSSNEDAEGTLTLRAEDKTSAGDNLTFLQSELRWETGDDGKERVLDADGNG